MNYKKNPFLKIIKEKQVKKLYILNNFIRI